MNLIMKHDGCNQFVLPHLKKSIQIKRGEDIARVYCDSQTVQRAEQFFEKSMEIQKCDD